MSRHPRNKRPLLSDVVASVERHAALQGMFTSRVEYRIFILCQIITIGDYPKHDTRRYFREEILKAVPEQLRPGLDFERLYDAFGGKLAHWQDFVTDYGMLSRETRASYLTVLSHQQSTLMASSMVSLSSPPLCTAC